MKNKYMLSTLFLVNELFRIASLYIVRRFGRFLVTPPAQEVSSDQSVGENGDHGV